MNYVAAVWQLATIEIDHGIAFHGGIIANREIFTDINDGMGRVG